VATPTDLSKFAIEIAAVKRGKSNRVLSGRLTDEMLTPVLEEAGLGLFMDKNNAGSSDTTAPTKAFRRSSR